ncbi:anhydro-N-acetylmuramic acid kinase [Micromonospora sp. NPDC049903]|uniref:anhydro-N-acetylmuramic acid kinase n=1 Tax=Micromonospora sp. NPDC049903 TaxID=3364276 RepID=UPI0037877378
MKIVGLMSGTSYDGVDVAVAEFTVEGDTLWLRPLGHRGLAYDDALRAAIGAVLPPGTTTIADVCRLDNRLGEVFAEAAAVGLELAGGGVDVVVSAGSPVLGYDVGPANALLDATAERLLGVPCDRDGARAAAGRVHAGLLAELLTEPYYAAPAPKSTGRELFHAGYLDRRLAALAGPVAVDDVFATLTELTARTVTDACDRHRVTEVIAAGGGVRNHTLWRRLRTTDELGVPAQAKEAYAFALLGWLSWHGLPGALPSVTGADRATVLGSWTPAGPPARSATAPAGVLPPRRLRVRA